MNNIEKDELVKTWIRLQNIAVEVGYEDPKADELFWSAQKMDELISRDPQAAWNVILSILKTDESRTIIQSLSAGPLEDLLVRHGEQVIDAVETEAKKNEKFAKLLGGVWKNKIKDEIWNRIQAVRDRRGWDGN